MFKHFRSRTAQNLVFGLVSILGISFWFWLAFPWQDSNESYSWYRALRDARFSDFFTTNRGIVPNLRPLNQLVAYAGYRLTGGGIYLHQLFNYIVAVLACFFACLVIREKKLFSLTCMLVGAFLFSMYIYLFHPHALGYSPVLLLIPSLIYLFDYRQTQDVKTIILAFVSTFVTYLFHPAAFLVFIGYFGGILIERRKHLNRKEAVLSGALLLISGTIVLAIRVHTASYSIAQQIAGLITSYSMLEVHRLISLFLFALVLLTVASMRTPSITSRVIIGLLASFSSFTFFYNHLPIAIIWIIVALLKMAILRKWSLALLIVFTAPLPLGLPFGSPTYAIYAMFACTLALPWGWEELERQIKFIDMKTVLPTYVLAVLLVILLRNGINLPIISSFANPLLAEKEKTYQLKEIMDWVLASNYRDCKVLLHHDKYSPAYSPSQAIARTHIPPTGQMYVDEYMEMMRGPLNNRRARTTNLIVTFGNEGLPGMRLLKSLHGRWAGRVSIFVSPPEQQGQASVQ